MLGWFQVFKQKTWSFSDEFFMLTMSMWEVLRQVKMHIEVSAWDAED